MTFLFDEDVPDDLSHLLLHAGHRVTFTREVLPRAARDADVLDHASQHGLILMTCHPDDFLGLASGRAHRGIIVVVRRRTRAEERAALLRLIERATETGITGNVNFA